MNNSTRKSLLLSWFVALSVLLVLSLTNCEGPEGPAGPAGADGTHGSDGTDITEAACLTCHNNDVIIEKRYELNMHDHATMANSLSRGGREGCGRCHSHENFRNYVETGADMSLETVTGLTCKSCHTLHDTSEVDSFSFGLVVDTSEVDFLTGGTETFGDGHPANLCITCHQPRRDYSAYDTTPTVGTDSVSITSSHAGPHYGMNGSLIFGKGADDRNGTVALNQGPMAHASAGCVSCHMGANSNHEFHPSVDNCESCHAGASDFDINGAATAMHDAIVAIEAELVAIGWYEDDGEGGISSLASSSAPLEMSGVEYTAFRNYNVLHADHGSIYHNPPYVKAIINNIEENLGLSLTSW